MAHIRKTAGFSIVELAITITVLSILFAIAVPGFQGYVQNINLKTAARELAGDFSYLKQKAISENRAHRIVFDTINNAYAIERFNGAGWDQIQKRVLSNYSSGITFGGTPPDFGGGTIVTFQPRGTVMPTGNVSVVNNRASTITLNVNIIGKVNVTSCIK